MIAYMSAVSVISTGAERSEAKRRDLVSDGQDPSTSLRFVGDDMK
jgi:hypothetical protein